MTFKETLRKTFFPTLEELKERNKYLAEQEKTERIKAKISKHKKTVEKNAPKKEEWSL